MKNGPFFYINTPSLSMLPPIQRMKTKRIRLTTHLNSSRKADCENAVCFLYVPNLVHSSLYNIIKLVNERGAERDGTCLIKAIRVTVRS